MERAIKAVFMCENSAIDLTFVDEIEFDEKSEKSFNIYYNSGRVRKFVFPDVESAKKRFSQIIRRKQYIDS